MAENMPGTTRGRLYVWAVQHAKAHAATRGLARLASRVVPDVPVTKYIPELGRLRFGLRRHRWFLGSDSLGGHALILGMFHRLVRPGDVLYDVGANIGYYTRFIVRHFPVDRIVAFEPMSANVRLLRENLRLGGCENRVTVVPVALSDHAGREDLQVDDMADGSAVLSSISGGRAAEGRRALGLAPKAEQVEVARLDDVVAARGLPRAGVIKIDTEGAEASVLRGALRTLADWRPRLAVSLHGRERGEETLAVLDGAGYACYGFLRGQQGTDAYGRIRPGAVEALANNNVVASMDEADVSQPIVPLDLTQMRVG